MNAWWAWMLVGLAVWLLLACLTAVAWPRWFDHPDRIAPPWGDAE